MGICLLLVWMILFVFNSLAHLEVRTSAYNGKLDSAKITVECVRSRACPVRDQANSYLPHRRFSHRDRSERHVVCYC